MAKAVTWTSTDAEARKRGEQTGLDTPVIPNNASPLRITAAAGTELAGASSPVTVIIITGESALQP